MSEYIWASGSRFAKSTLAPQVAGVELERLQQEHGGRITPVDVVEAARPVGTPLHPVFEWDDARAGELYRVDQARHVIGAIRVVQPRNDPREEPRSINAAA
jgi:hypothetical protein